MQGKASTASRYFRFLKMVAGQPDFPALAEAFGAGGF